MEVGFIGAGRMGAPMVSRLVQAGHRVTVLGRTAEKRTAIAELGAIAAGDIAAVALEVVVLCVFTDDQVRAVCAGPLLDAMPAGATLVIHTTGSPRTAQWIAERAPHVAVVDAPVSGGPHDIAAGRLTVFAGGTDDAIAGIRPVLASYADPLLHMGPLGAGQGMKLVNNTMFAAQIGLVAEAVRMGAHLSIDETALLGALAHGSGASRALEMIERAGSTQRFIGAVGEFLTKDVAVVQRTLADLGFGLGALEPVVGAGVPD
ncbi:NAD(P)-dependent oxidoreductase [Mycolicibacterium cosmeticum]|jgi:3-hydroxyisobutyrate dehydrogenase-like beta-hydroxyacid dehydrogenase|uniref:Beta-hydroxyacid dehydrogenase n=1 Tax=Mycolicibacterium cosmeticum TaxID=258533 RepID=W9AU64_MYCCO|nr:NAD(P)-dependent oxidoreductase [Mycolicibacterium cosmeticum]TLH66101.1 NAD(P)-dependent oxidoreductase [Mycolicibacterium cosmeticum]CDO06126.1 beta-hydroxyacid dehydrogenase [Mycolicibacterium cosmeticum]